MKRLPRPVSGLLAAALAIACAPRPAADLPQSWRPGVAAGYDLLLVTLDTTRADHLGAYGYPAAETPNLDRLAREGVRFTDAISTAPLTLPAHSSILTGLSPLHHGVRTNSHFRLGKEPTTLGEKLGAAGYTTAAFVSAFVLDERYGLARGFSHYDDEVAAAEGPAFAAGTLERKAPATTGAYLEWLAAQPAGKGLFAWIHYFDPHAPYEPPAELAARFPGRPYDGEIALVDRELGRVLQALEASGRLSRTLVVAVGDHGEGLGEHGEATHGNFLYDSTMRVPLILYAPAALGSGLVDGRVVSQVDLLPTLLELLGIADGAPRDGVSWVGRAARPEAAVYLETLSPYHEFGWAPLFALRTLRHKAILAPRREFYDLADDPREEHDLFDMGENHVREMLMDRLQKVLGETPGTGAPRREEDPEERARLEALGYIGGAGPAAAGGGPLADPKDRIAVLNALIEANAAMGAGRLDLAERYLRQAAAASPRERSVLHLYGKLQLRLGRPLEAEKSFRALAAIEQRADVSVLLAQIAIQDGREAEAVVLLGEAEQLDPLLGSVFVARGDLLLRQGRREEAAAAYRKALEIDPLRTGGMARERLEAF